MNTDFSKLSSWIELVNNLPRKYLLFTLDCISCCFLVRKSLSISSRLISVVFVTFIATINDNIEAYLSGNIFPLFAEQYMPIISVFVWILFNIFPFDVFYKLANFISPLIAFASGIIAGRNVCNGIDIFSEGNSIIYTLTCGVIFAFAKFIGVFLYARITKNNIRSVYVVLFELAIVSFVYVLFTDYYPIHPKVIRTHDEMKFVVQLLMACFELFRNYVNDNFFGSVWNFLTATVQFFIPYYGKTWIPNQPEK